VTLLSLVDAGTNLDNPTVLANRALGCGRTACGRSDRAARAYRSYGTRQQRRLPALHGADRLGAYARAGPDLGILSSAGCGLRGASPRTGLPGGRVRGRSCAGRDLDQRQRWPLEPVARL